FSLTSLTTESHIRPCFSFIQNLIFFVTSDVCVLQNQLMHESISMLQKKEKAIQEENNMLSKKIKEKDNTVGQQVEWHQQNQVPTSTSFLLQPHPCLNIG
uniref:Agamous-like MADS-box protein AGL8 homolog n=1 Tax=Nicotiana sylvestris TaxID=4096 RepID=A0A1U7XYA7_NICSY